MGTAHPGSGPPSAPWCKLAEHAQASVLSSVKWEQPCLSPEALAQVRWEDAAGHLQSLISGCREGRGREQGRPGALSVLPAQFLCVPWS